MMSPTSGDMKGSEGDISASKQIIGRNEIGKIGKIPNNFAGGKGRACEPKHCFTRPEYTTLSLAL